MYRYRQRHIALQIQYDGTAYYGFASQDLEDTVENHLFGALEKLNLISDRKVSPILSLFCSLTLTRLCTHVPLTHIYSG